MVLLFVALLGLPDLGSALRFSAPAECGMDAPLSSMIAQMTRFDPVTLEAQPPGLIAVPGIAEPIVPRFARERTVESNVDIRNVSVSLDLDGTWHGLRVTGLFRHFTEESDSSSVEIQFADSPEQVRTALNEAGFRLAEVGEWREVDADGVLSLVMGVFAVEGGASLVCAQG